MLNDAIRTQASFAAGLAEADLKPKTVRAARRILLDSLGCMAFGSMDLKPPARVPRGGVAIVGRGGGYRREDAVFANAAAMVRHELDEGNQAAFGHPACHFLPALLAAAEEALLEGRDPSADFFPAFVAAYETACRWSAAAKLREGVHVHGTAATVGAAVAAGRLNGDSPDRLASAMALAASLPQASTWRSPLDGDRVRDACVGLANLTGMNARVYAEMGMDAGEGTLRAVWESLLGVGVDEDRLTAGLGADFLIERNYFKRHSACRYVHGVADLVLDLMAAGLRADDVETLRVRTYSAAARLSGNEAANAFAAKFSIPVSIALLMLKGSLDPRGLSDADAGREDARRLAARIRVAEDPECTALLPELRRNLIEVDLKDGRTLKAEKTGAAGDWTEPFDDAALIEKFDQLSAPAWDAERRRSIAAAVLGGTPRPDLARIMELISR